MAFADARVHISLEDIWSKRIFNPTTISGFTNLNDGTSYCKLEQDENKNSVVNIYNYASGEKTGLLIDGAAIAKINGFKSFGFGSFELSADEQVAIIPTAVEGIYRHSTRSLVYIWDRKTNKLTLIDKDKVMYATLNKHATHIAYVKANNLYIRNLVKGKTKQVTKDGKHGSIINGGVDWVYEEEFSMSRGFEWNEDGTKIAYYRFDETRVKMWDMEIFGQLYPFHDQFKYPKAGEQNSVVDVYICDLKGKSKKLELGSENDQYLPRIKWTKDPNSLSVQRLNRLQNHLELLIVDASSGKSFVSLDERNNYYIDITDDFIFLEDKRHFIIKSEREGYWHLYMHKIEGPLVFEITRGNFEVDKLLGVDEKNQKVYFTSTEKSSIERHIYMADIDGRNRKRITNKNGNHDAVFSKDFSLFLHTYSTVNESLRYTINDNTGKEVRVIEDNAVFNKTLSRYIMGALEFEKIKVSTGSELNAYTIKPANFDSSKTYPLLMFVYGGPGSQQVEDKFLWSNYFWHQMLANRHGYIIACVDNRGTGGRGEEFKKSTYLKLGKYETEDQIAAAQYFGNLPYIDVSRIGIWGWSYGGYMSSLCIAKGNETFKMAIAVAPVTNWRYYDNIYTERFMRTPAENAGGYDDNSPINHVDKIKGNYLIVHGLADDNVHFQNTAEMINSMVNNNVSFDSEIYPNKNHGIYGGNTRLHLFTKMTNYILENL